MKPRRIFFAARLSFPFASALVALFAAQSIHAATLTWDNGAATGNWNTTDLNWGIPLWNNATPDDAVFGATGVGTVTLTEAITAGSLTINTAGYTITGNTLTLSGGATALTSNATSAVNSNVTIATSAGTITSSAGTLTLGGTLDAGSLGLTFAGAGNTTVSNAITNGTTLTKSGAGTLILNGANTYAGGTTINASSGTLQATVTTTTNALGTGSVSVGTGSTLLLNNTSTTGTTTISNTFTGAGLLKLQFAAGATARNTGMANVTGFTGTIQLSTLGTTGDKWSAANLGTVAGSLIVDSGTTIFATGTSAFSGGITLNGAGNNEGRGAIRLSGTLGGNINLASSSTINIDNAAGVLTGNITSGAAGTQTLTLGATGSTNGLLSGNIGGGTGTLVLTKASTGTYTLSGANTYTGATSVTGGILKAGVASVANVSGAFGNNSAVSLSNTAGVALDITGFNTQIGSLTGGGANGGNVTLGAATLTVGGNNTSPAAYAGAISGTGGVLTKIGTGTLTLSGANTFTGGLNVKAGTVVIATATSVNALGAGTVTIGDSAADATLRFTGSGVFPGFANPIAVAGTGTSLLLVTAHNPIFSSGVTLSNNLTIASNNSLGSQFTFNGGVTGTGNITVSLNNTSSSSLVTFGTTAVNNVGTLTFNNASVLSGPVGTGTGTNLVSAAVGTNVTAITQGSNNNPLTVSGAITVGATNKIFNSTGTALFTLSGGTTGTGNVTFNANSTGNFTVSTAAVNHTGLVTNSGTNSGTTTISSVIGTNVTGVTQNSATSQLTLSNAANTFTSAVTITQGQLNASSVTGFGATTATANLTLGGAGTQGTLNYTGGATSSARNIVVGGAGGGVINSATGLLTLSGTVSLANGPLTIGGANSVTIGSATATNRLSGTNTLTKTGAGTLTLSTLGGNVGISGAMPVNLQAGTLSFVTTNATTNNILGTGLITITPGATLTGSYTGNTASTMSNAITVAAASGTATIQTTSGAINFNTGAVNFASGSTAATILRLNNNNGTAATLTLGGAITGTGSIQLNPSAAGSPITLSGAQNQTGTITNVGTSTSLSTLSGAIGSNISGISQAGANPFTVSASVPLSAGLNTFTSTGAGAFNFTNTDTFSGAHSLTFNANSTGGITVSGTNLNHTGTITNSGTNIGVTTISSAIGGNVTDVVQNSATSALILSGSNSAYTGTYTATNGLMQFSTTAAMTGFTGTPNANVMISVASGGILGLAYPAFTATNVTDLVNNANGGTYSNVSFAATGASIGLDTTAGSSSFASVLANPTGSALGLVKLGTNTLTLGTANTFSGSVSIRNGTLSAGSLNSVTTPAPAGASSLGVPSSAANGTISLGFGTTTGTLSYTGSGETTDRVINLAGTTGGGGIDNSGGGTLTFSNSPTFTGVGVKTLTVSGASNTTFGAAIAGGATLGGVASASALTVAKTGAGTLLFGAPGSTVNTNTLTTLTSAGGIVDIGTSGLTISNAGLTVIQSTANTTINATGGGVLTISSNTLTNGGDIRPASGTTLTINANINTPVTNSTFWTAQGGALELNDSGTLVLTGTNTIGGSTIFTAAGTLSVGNIATNLGGTNALIFNSTGSRFLYTGTGETTALPVQLSGANGILDQSGVSGNLIYSGNVTQIGTAGVRTLTLQGSTAGSGQISGAISNNSATNTTGVTKAGTGTWTLSGANTYTGATTVNGGNLVLNPTGSLSNTGITVNSAGTVSPLAGFTVGNTLTAAAGGRLTLNAGGVLNLADGTIGNLNLVQNSTFAGNAATFAGGSIIFDISASAADMIDVKLNDATGTGLATSSGMNSISFNPIAGSLTAGNYTLINAAGTLNNSNFFLASPNLVVGGTLYNLSLGLIGTNEVLTVATGGAAATPSTAFWNGTTDTSWALGSAGGVATNWVAASTGASDTWAVPGSTTNLTMTANTVGTGGLSTTLDQAFTINSLAFSGAGTASAAGSTIASGIGGVASTLTINAAALPGNTLGNGITVAVGSGVNTISAPVILGGDQTWTNNSTNALAITGNITGTGLTLTTAGTGAIQIGNGGTTGSIATDVALVTNGVLAFNRSDTVTQGTHFASTITGTGALEQNGTGVTTLTGTNSYTGTTTVNAGTLRLNGSTTTTAGTYRVGNAASSNGTLIIETGSSLTTTATSSLSVGVGANAVGVVTQNGGAFTINSSNANNNFVIGQGAGAVANTATANGSFGAYNLNGGTVAGSQMEIGNGGGVGMLNITDGTFSPTGAAGQKFVIISRFGSSTGVVTVAGTGLQNPTLIGGANSAGIALGWTDGGSNNRAELNIGNRGVVSGGAPASGIDFRSNASSIGNVGIVNLLSGGTLNAGTLRINTGTPTAIVNLNGGTLKATQSTATFMQGLTSTYVQSAGALIDTDTFNITIGQPLLAPTGSGVDSLTISGAGYEAAPYVSISGDGVGATAIATIDGTGAITGYTITNPGVGYTNATVTLVGGGGTGTGSAAFAANTSGGLTKTGLGTLTLSGANTYTGATNVSQGTVQFANQLSLYNNTPASWTATNIVVESGATLALNVGGAGQFTATDVDTIKDLGTATGGFKGGSTLGLNTTGASFSYGTAIGDTNSGANSVGLAKLGTNTLTLTNNANSYTGPTTLFGGILSVAKIDNGGNTSGIGAATSAAANLVFRGGTLQYTGTGDTTDRNFTLGNATTAAGGGIDTTGATGPLVISGSMTGANAAAGTQTLTLTSLAASGANALNGDIVDSSGTALTGVTKAGAGAWTLGGANTYSGATVVSAGTLTLTGTSTPATAGSNTLSLTGGTLNVNSSGSVAYSTVSISGGTTINFNSGTLLQSGNMSGSGTLSFNGGTLRSAAPITISANIPINIQAGGGTVDTTGGNITSSSGFSNTASPGTFNIIGGNTLQATVNATQTGPVNITGAGTALRLVTTAAVYPNLWTIGTGSTLDINNVGNFSFAGLAGGGSIINTGASAVRTVTITGAGGNTFSGSIQQPTPSATLATAVTLNLSTPAATQTLSGLSAVAANNYGGPTTINQGTLDLTTTSPSLSGGLTFGATLGSTNVGTLDLSAVASSATFGGALTVQTNSVTANTINIGATKTLTINGGLSMNNNVDAGETRLTMTGGGALVVNGASITVGNNTVGANNSSEAHLNLAALDSFSATLSGSLTIQNQGDNSGADASSLTLSNVANSITAAAVRVGNSSTGAPQRLWLGSGINLIQTDLINLGAGSRDSGIIDFAGSGGSVTMRNVAGTGRIANVNLGRQSTEGTAYTTANLIDLTGNTADVAIGTFATSLGAKTAANTNDLRFDSGTLDILSINMAFAKGTGASINTITIGGGTVRLGGSAAFSDAGTGTLTLATAGSGELIINGGTVTTTASLLKGTGTGTATVTVSGGTLDMGGNNIGTLSNTITLTAASGTLQNVGTINGTGGLTKTTAGTLTLSGTNTYTGATTVSAGTLLVDGSTDAASVVTVDSGATLGGTGTIGGAVNVTGVLSPGASVESLKTGALTMNSGSTFFYEATDNTATGADLLGVNGALSLTDVTLNLTNAALSSGVWNLGDKLTLISYGGSAITSGFSGFADDTTYTYGANLWAFNYDDAAAGGNFTTDHNGGTNFVTFTVVPEPSAALLAALGSLILFRRRRVA